MDGYPPAFIEHNIPLLVVSGLGGETKSSNNDINYPLLAEKGFRISSDAPLLKSENAQTLLKHFIESDSRHAAWNSREHVGRNKFRINCSASRDCILPPRQADIPTDHSQPFPSPNKQTSGPVPVLHSPLSPLSPQCSLFPDGLIHQKWIAKHNELIPSAFIACYTLTSDAQFDTLHDNQLKTDINKIKDTISRSGQRTRLVIVLLSEHSVVKSPDVEDRLSNIRRATSLDPKTGLFFLPPQSSAVELKAFVDTILITLFPVCVEYYRDLSKHSRRKRNRGYIPPPTSPPTSGTSQTLSSQGWNIRYDFKLGVFAEFRQEMDAAIISYEKSYETLISEVFEITANWSPRWNEARLLADTISIRVLRCLLWNNHTTTACRRWNTHRDRMKDLVNRRGKGSSNYGWEAWEFRWSCSMAELLAKTQVPEFISSKMILLSPEKTIPLGERLLPWEYLHHPGYWYQQAIRHHYLRRSYAMDMPDEDRASPSTTPASKVAIRASTYDTYFCPEPHQENPLPGHEGIDHSSLIIPTYEKAVKEFGTRRQTRMVEDLKLQIAKEHVRSEAWENAFKTLFPLWQGLSYRKDGWWDIVEEVGYLLRSIAFEVKSGEALVAVNWELMDSTVFQQSKSTPELAAGLSEAELKPSVELKDSDIRSFLTATYAFEREEGKVGDLCLSQLSISSTAWQKSKPLTINEIAIFYEGILKPTVIQHDSSEPLKASGKVEKVSLRECASSEISTIIESNEQDILVGEGDLTVYPGQTRIIELSSTLRESGTAKAVSAIFYMTTEMFDLKYAISFKDSVISESFWVAELPKLSRKRLVRADPCAIEILPKPPKVEVRLLTPDEQYYISEKIELYLEIENGEDHDAVATLDVSFGGDNPPLFALNHTIDGESSAIEESTEHEDVALGTISCGTSTKVCLTILPAMVPMLYDLSAKVNYHLISDAKTPLSCLMASRLDLLSPFEANFDLLPRVHPDPWPSYFDSEGIEASPPDLPAATKLNADGLSQKWNIKTRYVSFATEALAITNLSIEIIRENGGINCQVHKLNTFDSPLQIQPNTLEECQFDINATKLKLEDRRIASIDLGLRIQWRRLSPNAPTNEIILPAQRFPICSSEPRVLVTATYPSPSSPLIHLEYTIENPSMHFLTFGVVMETSEDFAFSGPKSKSLNLLPLSRRTVSFEVVPSGSGKWIQPMCVVRDKYFQKVLRVVPAGEGVKGDGKGVLVWVPGLVEQGGGEIDDE